MDTWLVKVKSSKYFGVKVFYSLSLYSNVSASSGLCEQVLITTWNYKNSTVFVFVLIKYGMYGLFYVTYRRWLIYKHSKLN